MPDDIYWHDALAWSEQQADLLQRLARGERVNAEIDWEHVVDEVRDVGRSELRAVESLLTRALEHLLKIHGWPDSPAINYWKAETLSFLLDARNTCSPSMRGRVDAAGCYLRASQPISVLMLGGLDPRPWPGVCPFALADLLPVSDERPDINALIAKLHA